MNLNKRTLKNVLDYWDDPKRIQSVKEDWRILGWIEVNLIELGILKINEPFLYEENECYQTLILRLAKENATK